MTYYYLMVLLFVAGWFELFMLTWWTLLEASKLLPGLR